MEELYTRDEVAKHLKLSKRTIWRLVKEGRFRAVQIGHRVLFTAQDIAVLVEASRAVKKEAGKHGGNDGNEKV